MKRSISGLLFIVGLSSALFAGDRFARDDALEVVVDTKTNLMWQDNSDSKTIRRNWQNAIDYCENITLGGYDDWHLPNYNELYSIADRSRYNLSIDPTFANVVSDDYWSSTTGASGTSFAWFVDFDYGDDHSGYESATGYVRCVRDND